MSSKLIDSISGPGDLKELSIDELRELSRCDGHIEDLFLDLTAPTEMRAPAEPAGPGGA